MREMSSHSKVHVVPVAIAASLGVVGMGLLSDGVVKAADTRDTVNVTVSPSCTFNSDNAENLNKRFAGSAANGTEVNDFNDSGVHEFNLFCNDNNGFVVSAKAYDLTATGIDDVISYTDDYTHTGENSMWTAEISATPASLVENSPVPMGNGGTIISSDSNTSADGVTFTATYKAYVGSATPAGTYNGRIEYTLTASGTSNSGSGSQSGSGSESGSENGNEETGNGEESGSGEGSGNEETGNGESGGSGSGTQNPDSGQSTSEPASTSNTPAAEPQTTTLNNTYATYNTYNTTNYPSGGSAATTPVRTVSTPTVSAGTDDEVATTSGSSSSTTDNYESPLGVTSTTKAASKDSGAFDPAPILVAGILAASGVATLALIKSKEREE